MNNNDTSYNDGYNEDSQIRFYDNTANMGGGGAYFPPKDPLKDPLKDPA